MNKYTFGSTFYDGTIVTELVKPLYFITQSEYSIYDEGTIDEVIDYVVRSYITSDDLRIINLSIHPTNDSGSLLITGDLVRVEKVGKVME